MRGLFKRFAFRAPEPLINAARRAYHSLPPHIRYGRGYRRALAAFAESEFRDRKELEAEQEKRLETLIHHCFKNVPYYRRLFAEHGLKLQDIQGLSDLSKIPVLTKKTVKENGDLLVARNVPLHRREPAHTSGSTGTPLDFIVDSSCVPIERALAHRHLLWLGYGEGDKVARFREPRMSEATELAEVKGGGREMVISLLRGDEAEMQSIVAALQSFRPTFISAWPSGLYLLARWMRKRGITIHPPRYLVTSSENLYPHAKELIEEHLGAPVIDWYGQEESVAVAMQCEYSQGYHVQTEVCIVEFGPSVKGYCEIIGTNLCNMAMPFLRYKTGDLALRSDRPCPCGRRHPTIGDIVGREADFLSTPDGRVLSPLGLTYVFHHADDVREGQIVQEDLDYLRVLVVPWEGISNRTVEHLKQAVLDHVDCPGMRVDVETVEDIPRTPGGKRPFLVSKAPPDWSWMGVGSA